MAASSVSPGAKARILEPAPERKAPTKKHRHQYQTHRPPIFTVCSTWDQTVGDGTSTSELTQSIRPYFSLSDEHILHMAVKIILFLFFIMNFFFVVCNILSFCNETKWCEWLPRILCATNKITEWLRLLMFVISTIFFFQKTTNKRMDAIKYPFI